MKENSLVYTNKGITTLITDLIKYSLVSDNLSNLDNDALSLMVDETLKGVDIYKEYPSFYHKLTINADLRQNYIDAITMVSSDISIDEKISSNIKHLMAALSNLAEKIIKKWQVSAQDLSEVFFPSQKLVFRAASDFGPHYMLLNEEIELQPVTYSILLEGTLSDRPDMLSLEVDLAISENADSFTPALPVDLEITWGDYCQHLTINDESVVTLMDIPFSAFLNLNMTQVTAAMELSLSRPQ